MSGCIGGNNNPAPSTAASSTTPGATKTATGANAVVQAVQSGNTITISGVKTDQDNDQVSSVFNLEKGTYIYSWDNKGSFGDIFTATIDSTTDKDLSFPISLWDAKGTFYMDVADDSLFTKPGPAKLVVGNGGTYTVTITKPTTGDNVPLTIKAAKGEQMAKAVKLNPGPVTINVKHTEYSKDKIGTTSVGLHNVETGKYVSLDGAWITNENGEATGTIDTAGLYVFSITFSAYTGGEATISQ